MISLCDKIPELTVLCAETVKINCIYNVYNDIALFWIQDNDRAVIAMLDGNMVIYNRNADTEELREFINVISPRSVFSDADTLSALFGDEFHRVAVMASTHKFVCDVKSDAINSAEIYNLLNVDGLELPPYEYFAVDFCLRLNRGQLKYFAIKDCCAAVCISDGNAVLLNGISSHKKGMGTTAVCGALSQYELPAFAVCEETVVPFYLKNKFSLKYYAGYWRKNP